ncbi:MAG: EAL domain-containing protein [Gallionellaceae bacterium]
MPIAFQFRFCVLVCLGLLSQASNAYAQDIRVGVYENKPKIFTNTQGAPSGIFIDILKAIGDKEGWQLRYVNCEWDECLNKIEAGDIDLMPDVAYSYEREITLDFHATPALYSWSQIYRNKDVAISSILNLKDRRVAMLSGGIQEDAFLKLLDGYNIKARLITTKSMEEAFLLTQSGGADAVISGHHYGDFHKLDYQLIETPIIFQPSRLFYVAAQGRNAELLNTIDKHLLAWVNTPDSPYFQIVKRWGGFEPTTISPPIFWNALIMLSALILLSILGLAFLRKQVKLKTLQLSATNNQLQATLNAIPDLLFEIGLDGVYHSYYSANNNPHDSHTPRFAGNNIHNILPPEAAKTVMNASEEAHRLGYARGEYENSLADGKHWFEFGVSPKPVASGEIPRLLILSRDITRRKKMEDSLLKFSQAVEQSPNSIIISDLDGNIEYVNTSFSKVSGYTLNEVIGKNPRMLQSGKTPAEIYTDMWLHLARGDAWRGSLINRSKAGAEYVESTLISPIRQADGKITHYLAIHENITEKKQAEERIDRLVHFDQLTGLPNRILLNDRFQFCLGRAQRNNEELTVIFLDLDHFKNINDTLGHTIGDQLLIEVAKRLKAALREEDTLSRQGGDDFILILPNTGADGAAHVATKLIETVSQTCYAAGHELNVTPSIGIALYPHDGEDLETLSKNADSAMYRVKQNGRNDYCFFTPEMQVHSARTLQLSSALRHALARNELQLHYQPQISLKDGSISGAEALLRWTHPQLGPISPAEFIPIAESSGQIIPIGEWVLRTAISQLKTWLGNGIPAMVMAVNLSAAQFRQPNLTELVTSILNEANLPHEHLELELTEAVAMNDPKAAMAIMDKLFEHGIRMSIDDFGTGYSSLSYLKRFNVYKLKIDQSFVSNITDDPEDKAIVTAIINMASSLGMLTIAEGVETAGQLEFLRATQCDEVQGYYFSKPLPAAQFEAFAKGHLKI